MNSFETYYTQEHLWVKPFGLTDYAKKSTVARNAYVGITGYIKSTLIEDKMWYVRVGKTIDKGQNAGIIYTENVHIDIIMPVSGTILQANLDFLKLPFWSNTITEKDWIMIISIQKPGELSELMPAGEYQNFINIISVK
jgi:glycine cleavage system H lipoate-binding protein